MEEIDEAWADPATWNAIRATGQRFTSRHYLNAVDMRRLPDGSIAQQPEERRIYLPLLWRTLVVSAVITLLCLLLGYPVAHLIAHAPPRRANLLLALVLVPFWTSLLVRTTAWIVLLQTQGVINDLLVGMGLVGEDGRLAMIYNMTGTIIAMTHVLLPFMVLPLYSVMRAIPGDYMNAAASLGAKPAQAFFRVYWPQTLPGWARVRFSSSSWRSATTSRRRWWAAAAASSSPTWWRTTCRPRSTGVSRGRWAGSCWRACWCSTCSTTGWSASSG